MSDFSARRKDLIIRKIDKIDLKELLKEIREDVGCQAESREISYRNYPADRNRSHSEEDRLGTGDQDRDEHSEEDRLGSGDQDRDEKSLDVSSDYNVSDDFEALTDDDLDQELVARFLVNLIMDSEKWRSTFLKVLKTFLPTDDYESLAKLLSTDETEESSPESCQQPCSRSRCEVLDGKSVLLASNGCTGLSCQWKKNEKKLMNDSNFSGVDKDVLLIKNVCQGMEGEYRCYCNDQLVSTLTLKVKFSASKEKLVDMYKNGKEVYTDLLFQGRSSYVKLALVNDKKDQVCNSLDYSIQGNMDDIIKDKSKVKYDDVFSKFEKGVLVIEGRPGCGKTTLTRKITKDWARGFKILRGAKELYLVPLRFLASEKINSLSDILEHIYEDYLKTFASEKEKNLYIAKEAVELDKNQGEGACFVLDGLDEYKERNNRKDVIYRLLHKEYLYKAMIIVASRPVGTANVKISVIKRVEVLGFSKEQISKYVEEYSFNDGISSSGLQSELKKHVNVHHMCYLPVHAAMICYIYNGNYDGSFPGTETEIFEQFTLLTIKRKLEKDDDLTEVFSLEGLKGNLLESLRNVCKRAFDMTIKSIQAVSTSQKDSWFSDVVGSNTHSLGLVTIDSTAWLTNKKVWYSFLHLKFQEFLAAYYLTTLVDADQLTLIKVHIRKSEMSVVWKFYCGLRKKQCCQIDFIMAYYKEDDLYRFQCALESQEEAVCDSAFQYGETTAKGTVRVSRHNFSIVDFYALGYFIAHTSNRVTELEFTNCSFNSDEGAQYFIKTAGQEKLSNINSLSFINKSDNLSVSLIETARHLFILRKLLESLNSLEILQVENQFLNEIRIHSLLCYFLRMLSISIPGKSSKLKVLRLPVLSLNILKELSLVNKCLEEIEYYKTIGSHKQIIAHLLTAFDCTIIPLRIPQCNILCNFDIKFPRVKKILQPLQMLLVNCNVGDNFVTEFSKADISHCEILRLDFNRITCAGMEYFSEHCLPKLTNLSCLSMACNQIGDDGAIALAQDLHKCKNSLTELDLQGNVFGDHGAIPIACAVNENFPASFELHLWNINITVEGVASVLKHRSGANVKNEKVLAWKYVSSEGIAKAVQCCMNLHTLDLSSETINFSMSELAPKLKVCTNFKNIDFSHCSKMTPRDLTKIVESLSHCKLQTFNLNSCEIDNYGALVLAKCLTAIQNIHELDDLVTYPDFVTDSISDVGVHNLSQHMISLDLGNNDISSAGAKVLGCGLKYCHELKSLNLCSNGIEADGAKMLANGLESCHSLQNLTMDDNPLGADSAAEIFSAIENFSDMKALSFGNTGLCYSDDLLKDCLTGPPSFTSFSRDYNHRAAKNFIPSDDSLLDLKCIEILTRSVTNWSQFEELNLSCNSISCKAATRLAGGLCTATNLVRVDLENNLLCAKGMAALIDDIKNCQLKYLNIGGNIISQKCVWNFCNSSEVATHNPVISEGSLCANLLSNKLCSFVHLNNLDLSCNDIGPSGVQALMKGIKGHLELEVLNLTDNGINSDGTVALATVLNTFPKLNTLCLSKNDIGPEGIENLMNINSENLCMLNNIQVLQLGYNNILLKGALALGEGLKYCNNILRLDLQSNSIDPEGACAIAEGLKHCRNILHLDLQCNSIGQEGSNAIAKSLEDSNIRYLNLQANFIENIDWDLAMALRTFSKLEVFFVHENNMSHCYLIYIVESLDYCSELKEFCFDQSFSFNCKNGETWEEWKVNCLDERYFNF